MNRCILLENTGRNAAIRLKPFPDPIHANLNRSNRGQNWSVPGGCWCCRMKRILDLYAFKSSSSSITEDDIRRTPNPIRGCISSVLAIINCFVQPFHWKDASLVLKSSSGVVLFRIRPFADSKPNPQYFRRFLIEEMVFQKMVFLMSFLPRCWFTVHHCHL